MTLNTEVVLIGDITLSDAFDLALKAILKAAGRSDEFESAQIHRSTDSISTILGQGLPAITDANEISSEDYWDSDEDETWFVRPGGTVAISWDTAYGYNHNGLNCSELHAYALMILSESLPEGVTLKWENEFTGEWHDGLTEENIADFVGTGRGASVWFEELVKPMILGEK